MNNDNWLNDLAHSMGIDTQTDYHSTSPHDEHHNSWQNQTEYDHFSNPLNQNSLSPDTNSWHSITSASHYANHTESFSPQSDLSFNPHHQFDSTNPHGIVIGNPAEEMNHWHQQISADSCGIAAQQNAIEHINHQSYSQEQLLNHAQENHWYNHHIGTSAEDFGKLITEQTGVSVEHHYNTNITEIMDKLSHGEQVFVGVNSNIEWLPDHNSILGKTTPDLFDPHHYQRAEANHIIQVIGVEIDPINSHNSYVIVNDSTSPNGRGMEIPLDQFQEAMKASHGYMASTDSHHHHLAENFDHNMTFRGGDNYGFDGDRRNFYVNGDIRGHCDGNKIYTNYSTFWGDYKGCIKDMNIYDAKDNKVGYLDGSGNVHKNDGTIALSGKDHSGFENAAYYLLDLVG